MKKRRPLESNDLKNKNTWLNFAKNIYEWKRKQDTTPNTLSMIGEPDATASNNTTSPAKTSTHLQLQHYDEDPLLFVDVDIQLFAKFLHRGIRTCATSGIRRIPYTVTPAIADRSEGVFSVFFFLHFSIFSFFFFIFHLFFFRFFSFGWSAQWFCVDSCAVCGGADEPSTASLRGGTRVLWVSTGTPRAPTRACAVTCCQHK